MTPERQNSVLVVDDEPGVRMALQANFRREGWEVETAAGASEAMGRFKARKFPLVVTDVRMPDGDGLDLMRKVRNEAPSTAVVLLTAYGTVPEAVRAMRGGACDYLTKPISFEQLQAVVANVMQKAESATADADLASGAIVGNSPLLLHALNRAKHAARTNADVLIQAESGTGKELLARLIHESSSRAAGPFVALNCAAVPEHLLESELFGHARGAFTGATTSKPGKFELANGGTLLLDEVGDMPLALQPKLLRALQEREFERLGEHRTIRVDIRVIATTNVSLQKKIEDATFRADLYYRLNVIPMTLPPLRERPEDLSVLAEFFARKFAKEAGVPTPVLQPDFLEGLQRHTWPGNIRELANLMKRLVTLNDSNEIGLEQLKTELHPIHSVTHSPMTQSSTPVVHSLRDIERQLLERTLETTGGNRTHTAELLGLSLRTVRNKIREYGLPPRRYV
jgi:DNA-binding NtrC family response regulator